MKAWYLLYCKPKGELRAQQNLAMQQIEAYFPTFPQSKRGKNGTHIERVALFPCYIFIYFDPKVTSVARIHSTRGAVRIVGCREQMTAIDDNVIENIKLREQQLNLNVTSTPIMFNKDVEAASLKAGDKVRFTEGPFLDLEGVFEEQNGEKRCYVLFEFMGKQQKMNVKRSKLAKSCKSSVTEAELV